jgi:hypothetical protein
MGTLLRIWVIFSKNNGKALKGASEDSGNQIWAFYNFFGCNVNNKFKEDK